MTLFAQVCSHYLTGPQGIAITFWTVTRSSYYFRLRSVAHITSYQVDPRQCLYLCGNFGLMTGTKVPWAKA